MTRRWWLMLLPVALTACSQSPLVVAQRTVSSPVGSPSGVNLGKAIPIDEGLRAEYARCDATDSFRGLHFPIKNAAGATIWYPCHSDPSRLDQLVKLPGTDASPVAVIYTSKLGLDLDGSWIACNRRGVTDQCGTSLMLPARDGQHCTIVSEVKSRCIPVDADRVPYVVLPASGPRGAPASEFRNATGIQIGDYGAALFNGNVVPVIVADSGPYYKIGEGSMALHRALGNEFCSTRDVAGNCTATKRGGSIASGVVTFIFPGSHTSGLTPDNIESTVQSQGAKLYGQLTAAYRE